jgi:hypothetical protein
MESVSLNTERQPRNSRSIMYTNNSAVHLNILQQKLRTRAVPDTVYTTYIRLFTVDSKTELSEKL